MQIDEALATVEQTLAEVLTGVEEAVFRQSWLGSSYTEIANLTGYAPDYIKDSGYRLWQKLSQALGVKVTKNNFKGVLRQLTHPGSSPSALLTSESRQVDWGEAIDVSQFYGRTPELDTLKDWILTDRCRLVTLLGIGGIGKTSLSIKLAQEVQAEFEFVFWRSLRNAPPLSEILAALLKFFSHQQDISSGEDTQAQWSRLLPYLRQHRCLIILDNFDALMQPQLPTGSYREGAQVYGQFLQQFGEMAHASCLAITSREKPSEVAALETADGSVRTLPLAGLDGEAGQRLLTAKSLDPVDGNLPALVERYQGNPLALKIAASSIQELFSGRVSEFLQQPVSLFNGIQALFDQQWQRLSILEQQIMGWLAINRDPTSLAELKADLVPQPFQAELLTGLESLRRRSLIESISRQSNTGFTQQPVVMEYVTNRLIEQSFRSIVNDPTDPTLYHYALMKATARDLIRASQVRLIITPLLERLLQNDGSQAAVAQRLQMMIQQIRIRALLSGYTAGNLINLLVQLGVELNGSDFSGLYLRQVDLSNTELVNVDFRDAHLLDSSFIQHFGSLLSVAFSPDGQMLAFGDSSGEIRLWDIHKQKLIHNISGQQAWTAWVAFSLDGKTLAANGLNRQIKIFDVKSGGVINTITAPPKIGVLPIADPHFKIMAMSRGNAAIPLVNMESQEVVETLEGHSFPVFDVAFCSALVDIMASGSHDGSIRIWNIKQGQCLKTLVGHTNVVWKVAFSPVEIEHKLGSGFVLASGCDDHTVRIWDVDTGECLQVLAGHTGGVYGLAFSPHADLLVSSSDDKTLRIWDVKTAECLQVLQGHRKRVWSVAFNPALDSLSTGMGLKVASVGDDNLLKLWDASTGECLHTQQGHNELIWAMAHSNGGQYVASVGSGARVRLWDWQSGKCLKSFLGHSALVLTVAFSPDDRLLASAGEDGLIKVWEIESGQCLQTLSTPTHHVRGICFSPDGKILFSGGFEQIIRVWDIQTGECLQQWEGHGPFISSLALNAQGQVLAIGSLSGELKFWDVSTGQCLQSHNTPPINTIAFNSSGNLLISGAFEGSLKIWDVASGQCLKILEGDSNTIHKVACSTQPLFVSLSEGNKKEAYTLIASGGGDGVVKLWDLSSGECLRTWQAHPMGSSVTFSPDNQHLITGSADETIKVWNLETGECIRTFKAPGPYEDMNISGAKGLSEGQKLTLQALGAVERT